MSAAATPTPTVFRLGRRTRGSRHRLDRARAGLASPAASSASESSIVSDLSLEPASACRRNSAARARCGLGPRLGPGELFFCFRERMLGASVVDGSASESCHWASGNRRRDRAATYVLATGRARRITLSLQSRWPDRLWGRATIRSSTACRARSSPKRRIFLSPVQNCLGASHRVRWLAALIGVGVLMPPTAAAGPTVCDYPACTPGIAPQHGPGRAVRQHHLLRVRGHRRTCSPATQPGRLMFCGSPRQIPAEMVPLTADGGNQGRERRLQAVFELRRAGARRAISDLHSAAGKTFWTRADT